MAISPGFAFLNISCVQLLSRPFLMILILLFLAILRELPSVSSQYIQSFLETIPVRQTTISNKGSDRKALAEATALLFRIYFGIWLCQCLVTSLLLSLMYLSNASFLFCNEIWPPRMLVRRFLRCYNTI